MMKKMKIATILRKDEGLSLAEILVSVGLTGLLALGCTQLALASFTSASYTEAIAMKSVDSGNANRMVTTDMESASGFLVPSKSGALPATSQCTTSSSNSVRPLVTLAYANGNMVGYEVRTNADSGSLWRIACPTRPPHSDSAARNFSRSAAARAHCPERCQRDSMDEHAREFDSPSSLL